MDKSFIRESVLKYCCPFLKPESCQYCRGCSKTRETDASDMIRSDRKSGYLERLKVAAVLIGIQRCPVTNRWRYIMTLRSKRMNRSGGESCFPGGMVDTTDSSIQETALREAEEEIGLRRDQAEVIAVLPPLISKYGVLVHRVVAFIDPSFKPKPCTGEVESIFYVDVERPCQGDNHRANWIMHCGQQLSSDYFDYECQGHMYTVYGLTGAMLLAMSSILDIVPQCEYCKDYQDFMMSCGGYQNFIHIFLRNFDTNGHMHSFKPIERPDFRNASSKIKCTDKVRSML